MNSLPVTPTKRTMASGYPSQGRSDGSPLDLAEFGADPQARGPIDVVFGFSNQKNRRDERLRRSSFDATKSVGISPTSTASSSPSISCPQTPSPSAQRSGKLSEKKSFFNMKNASTPNFPGFGRAIPSTPSPTRPSAPIGLGINMGGAVERTAPIPASYRFAARKGLKTQPASRLFKVGKGPSATYFEPVPLSQAAIALASSSVQEDTVETLTTASCEEDDDSSDDEFVSFQDSYENLISSYTTRPEVQTVLGPSNLAELMALRQSTQAMYTQAVNQAGPSTVRTPVASSSSSIRKLPRKAVPSYVEVIAGVVPETTPETTASSPVIPERAGSLPATPVMNSEAVHTPKLDSQQHSRTPSGQSTGSSASSLLDGDSSRASLCSSVSTLASPVSESGSMPVTPLTAAHSPRGSPFFAKEKTFELDVASVFYPHSPPRNDLELPFRKSEFISPNKSFYQNQAATQSSWAIITSKFRQPSNGQEKTRFKRFFGKSQRATST